MAEKSKATKAEADVSARTSHPNVYAALIAATAVASPYLMSYDLTMILLALVLTAGALGLASRSVRWVLIGVYLTTSFSSAVAQATHVQIAVVSLSLLLLWLAFFRASAGVSESLGDTVERGG